jgi:hypothetical protein
MQGDNRGKAWPRHGHILVGAHGVEGPGEEANERWTLQRSSGMTVPRYVCTADTEPPPGNVIRCDSTNILIRSLLLNKAKQVGGTIPSPRLGVLGTTPWSIRVRHCVRASTRRQRIHMAHGVRGVSPDERREQLKHSSPPCRAP